MNELVKILRRINRDAFIAVKKCEYYIKHLIREKKVNKTLKEFDAYTREDVTTTEIPKIKMEDYPCISDLTRYMRNEYGKNFTHYIEVENQEYMLILKLVAITDEPIRRRGMFAMNNGYGKMYNYQEFVIEQ